jgi:hypothetical protein
MKLSTILNPLLREEEMTPNPKWVMPNPKALEQEYNVEYKRHVIHETGNIWPTLKDFVNACHNGHPMVITPQLDNRIRNRSHTESPEELLELIKTYRSYPEFRNVKTLQNLYDRMEKGQELDMPILIKKRNSSTIHTMSGNTRMDVAFQVGINPTCLVVEY